jgi:hypothetical protein
MNNLNIGWAQGDLTPEKPVFIAGQFHARVSEGITDPVTVTALVLEKQGEYAIFVSCDLVSCSEPLQTKSKQLIGEKVPDIDPEKIILNATHTHTAPRTSITPDEGSSLSVAGVKLDVMNVNEYTDFAAEQIGNTIIKAWQSKAPGEIAFGEDYAVVGRNRRWVDTKGNATMYGNTDTPLFSHIEGYEDHSVGLVATRNKKGQLTGLIVNVPSPAQVEEHEFKISADYWHNTREKLRKRLGKNLFILPQCSAAGDQSPHLLYGKAAEERMLKLSGQTQREAIAERITRAVSNILPYINSEFSGNLTFMHEVKKIDADKRPLTENNVNEARNLIKKYQQEYNDIMEELNNIPLSEREPRWYRAPSRAFTQIKRQERVLQSFEEQQKGIKTISIKLHIIRLGDIVFATNPYEYYLDFGIYIKARSKAIQTFIIQLAGRGTYVSSFRAIAGGGYGSIPSSNAVGAEGGRKVADETINTISKLWQY